MKLECPIRANELGDVSIVNSLDVRHGPLSNIATRTAE